MAKFFCLFAILALASGAAEDTIEDNFFRGLTWRPVEIPKTEYDEFQQN